MKALTKIFIAAIAAASMTACNNELSEQTSQNGGNVNFTMGIGSTPSSRVSMPESSYTASFTGDDEVGVFVSEVSSYSNIKYSTTDGTTWTGGPIEVPTDAEYTYYAYCPYKESMTASNIPVVVATNQDTDGYIKNDYLYSKLAATSGQTDVNLTFNHALSLVEVTLAGSGAAEGATVNLFNVATDATMDIVAGKVTTGSVTADVTMDALSNLKYRAIIPAQTIAASTPAFKIAVNGRTYQAKYSGDINFEQGKYLAMTITLGEQGGDDAQIEITTTADIADWGEGTSNGGNASVSVAELNIPLPVEGVSSILETIEANWSPSVGAAQVGSSKAEGWYKRTNTDVTDPTTVGYDSNDQALTIKRLSTSTAAWNKDQVIYHSSTPLERGKYILSFEFKDDGADTQYGAVGVGISASGDNKLFKMLNLVKDEESDTQSLEDWGRTLTLFTAPADAAWSAKTVYFSFEDASINGSTGSSVPTYTQTTDDDVNKGVNIIFYSNKSGAETTLSIRNIKLIKYEE